MLTKMIFHAPKKGVFVERQSLLYVIILNLSSKGEFLTTGVCSEVDLCSHVSLNSWLFFGQSTGTVPRKFNLA